ncbi:MAG: pyruvate kinase [Saprospiraceae bacterium]|nr:pyruvate kinase [Saprospiraceae bacterium]
MSTTSISLVRQQLERMEKKMLQEIPKKEHLINPIHPHQKLAARNLLHYLCLRSEDIRDIQDQLHMLGLSSLASAESHIHRQVQAILQRLGKKYAAAALSPCTYSFSSEQILRQSTNLFGKKDNPAIPFIMVTFDGSFADNYLLIKKLLQNGMNVARINCAHDAEPIWAKMIRHIKRACKKTGKTCKIYMDLAGPKIRTQLLSKGSEVGKVKIKPGQRIWLAENNIGFNAYEIVVGTNESGILSGLKKGEQVLIDDGLIRGIIEKNKDGQILVQVTRVSSKKDILHDGKGINFPDSNLLISSLTEFDKSCIPFICKNADLIGYSFVRKPSDVAGLQKILHTYSSKPPFIILKVETPEAVKNLPALLIQGMHQKAFGVMIARGDLAVEIGFERMGEIQEEILWICEAAHAPVIWATQVLENLNKSGVATRAEITDAAHAALAECVMVNKGNHTLEVIKTLQDILHRIGGHHIKKRFTFRPLGIAKRFIDTN